MQRSHIRGGTPVEYWGEQHSINDPELIARLKDVARLTNLRQAEHIQESIDAANAIFQPLPDDETSISDAELTARLQEIGRTLRLREAEHLQESIDAENAAYQPLPYDESPEPEESPIGGLPSPAPSPPPTNPQLHAAQATSSTVKHLGSEPVEVEKAGAEVEADSSSGLRDEHLNTQTGYQPQPLLPQPSRKESRRRQPSHCSTITTRSQASDRHTFWELDSSGRRGRKIMDRPLFGAADPDSVFVQADSNCTVRS
ncbi:MAG: hypothetical protein LQ341_003446 [Variospora aurantia]|nr:MAG: hypothetical protein LQ341_003446 [Variospora aurantia]